MNTLPRTKSWRSGDRTLHAPLRAWKRRPRIRPGTLPGTLVPPSEPQPPARITLIRFSRDAFEERESTLEGALADMNPGGVTWILVDAVVDAYFPVVEALSERMAELEQDAVLGGASTECLIQIQQTRHDLLTLRRAVWPIREEVGVLVRDESGLITAETRVFLRDAYDHAVQALELVESLRETATSVMEIYLSAQNQRLNEVMKVLTVISTLFIPLTFIASIYGMNFQFMPELHWRYGYLWALGLMVATAAGLVTFFKRRGWW